MVARLAAMIIVRDIFDECAVALPGCRRIQDLKQVFFIIQL